MRLLVCFFLHESWGTYLYALQEKEFLAQQTAAMTEDIHSKLDEAQVKESKTNSVGEETITPSEAMKILEKTWCSVDENTVTFLKFHSNEFIETEEDEKWKRRNVLRCREHSDEE